jgi:hypothetical protein
MYSVWLEPWNKLVVFQPMKGVVPATHRQITATGLSRRGIREPRHGWPTGLGTKHAFTNSSQFGWVQKRWALHRNPHLGVTDDWS